MSLFQTRLCIVGLALSGSILACAAAEGDAGKSEQSIQETRDGGAGDGSTSLCLPGDTPESEPNDTTPNFIGSIGHDAQYWCGEVSGRDVDKLAFAIPEDALMWGVGVSVYPDTLTDPDPPFLFYIDGELRSGTATQRTAHGRHTVEIRSKRGERVDYHIVVVLFRTSPR